MNIDNIDYENFYQNEVNLWGKLQFASEIKKLLANKDNDLIECYEDDLGTDEMEIYNAHNNNEETENLYKNYINNLTDFANSMIIFSKINNLYFFLCVYEIYEETLNDRLIDYLSDEIEVDAKDFYINEFNDILIMYETIENEKLVNFKLSQILEKSKTKKLSLLTTKLDEVGIYVYREKNDFHLRSLLKTKFEFIEKKENLIAKVPTINKNLLFDGKPLNLSERYQIANKVLDIEKKITTLNISKDKKNELLSYILGCNIDSAKKLLNGTYDAKPRNLESYFKDLDLNK